MRVVRTNPGGTGQAVFLPNGGGPGGSNIQSGTFGESQSGDAGRVLELTARIQF
jgi:hypothetical protein